MARKPRGYFKASPWELEDAEEEQVEIVINHEPKRFVIENGRAQGDGVPAVRVDAKRRASSCRRRSTRSFLPADDVILAIGQEAAFPWIEKDIGIEFDKWDVPVVDKDDLPVDSRPGVFFGGDAAWGPLNIIWAVEHAHQAAISHPQPLPGHRRSPSARPPGMNLVEREDGPPRVGLQERLQPGRPRRR